MSTMRALLLLVIGCAGGSKGASGGPACEPGRCLEDLSRVISEHRAEARTCYDNGLKRVPAIKDGRIIINFEIDPDGKVIDASQSVKGDQIEDPEVVACVTDVIKEIRFPKSASGKRTRGYHSFEFAMHPTTKP